jgi:hypothetical protein
MKKILVVLACLASICLFQHAEAEVPDGSEEPSVVPLYTPSYSCTGSVFNDVNASMSGGVPFCGFIEHFSTLGITSGCSAAPPLYCPNSYVTRAQMAVFVSKAVQDMISQTSPPQSTAFGNGALVNSTLGPNTAVGDSAMFNNVVGANNTAVGFNALMDNYSGVNNTAVGHGAGASGSFFGLTNITGSQNTFIGTYSGQGTTEQLTYATAIGALARVSASYSLVLGGTGDYKVKVGIGTETPGAPLDVRGPGHVVGRFTNDASLIDKTALLELVTGDITPRRWYLGVGGSGNGLGLGYANGEFYLESLGNGVAMAFSQNRNVSFFPSGGGTCGLSNGALGWACSSDRNLKENFTEIDKKDLLENLDEMPVTKWNVKGSSIAHIGPTAQDFYSAFKVGEDDTHINTVDAQGVSLAAIQALYQLVKEQQEKIRGLEKDNAALRADIEKRLALLELSAQRIAQR